MEGDGCRFALEAGFLVGGEVLERLEDMEFALEPLDGEKRKKRKNNAL